MIAPRPYRGSMAAISLVSLCLATNLAAQESPRLSIEPGGPGTVHIEWPIGMGLYSLEQLSALNGVDQWLPISQPAQVRSKNFQLEVPATDEARFYRLRLAAEPDPGVAPDPAAIAPLYPPNADQSFVEGTAFLYSGASPVHFRDAGVGRSRKNSHARWDTAGGSACTGPGSS